MFLGGIKQHRLLRTDAVIKNPKSPKIKMSGVFYAITWGEMDRFGNEILFLKSLINSYLWIKMKIPATSCQGGAGILN